MVRDVGGLSHHVANGFDGKVQVQVVGHGRLTRVFRFLLSLLGTTQRIFPFPGTFSSAVVPAVPMHKEPRCMGAARHSSRCGSVS